MQITSCRLCSEKLTAPILDLGFTPLANEFLSFPQKQDTFPLQVCKCSFCGHFQLNYAVNEERLFRHYAFVSGTSSVNIKHFQNYANLIVEKQSLLEGSKVLDIASNDGTLLQQFKQMGMKVLGIDPARNIADVANKNGVETIPEFFTEQQADHILEKYGQFDVITANNVFAHATDLMDFAKGVKKLLTNNGVFIFEVSYFLDVCQHGLMDTIYHEHKDYHLIGPLVKFFRKLGMMVDDVQHIETHGGSVRVFVKLDHFGLVGQEYFRYVSFLTQESDIDQKVEILKLKIELLGYKLREKLQDAKQSGKSIAIYGAPAKATTLMYALQIDDRMIDFVVDDNPIKQNTYTPGKHLLVVSDQFLRQYPVDIVLVLAWNFADSIIHNHSFLNVKWIVPLPELVVR